MKKDSKNDLLAYAVIFAVVFAAVITFYLNIFKIKIVNASDKELFTQIYSTQEWGGWRGVGPGSTEEDGAKPFLSFLQDFLDSHQDINSVVDMGCGYGELLKNIRLYKHTKYLGLDIVDGVIKFNKENYERDNFSYNSVDAIEDLVDYKGDLLILKDVMQYWSTEQILFAKELIIPNFKYVIAVNTIETTWNKKVNEEIETGNSRPLDLAVAPFYMTPLYVEDYRLPPFRVKRIYLFVNSEENVNSGKN